MLAGKLRVYDVSMGGTNWRPELPSMEKLNQLIKEYYISKDNKTTSILEFMCRIMKMQLFSDGNKRTAMLIANHELIKNGKGIVSISNENKIEFGSRLIQFYENDEKIEDLEQFIFEKCLDGIER